MQLAAAAVRLVVPPEPALFLHCVALVVEVVLRDLERPHAVGFEENPEVELIGRQRLEVERAVLVGRAVHVAAVAVKTCMKCSPGPTFSDPLNITNSRAKFSPKIFVLDIRAHANGVERGFLFLVDLAIPAAREERRVRAEDQTIGSDDVERGLEDLLERQSRRVLDPRVRARRVEMHVGTAVREHQRFAQHAGAEVRNDDRHRRMLQRERRAGRADCRSGCRTWLGRPSFLRMPTDSTPQCANTATRSTVPPRRDAASSNTSATARIVQGVAVHRGEQADRAQPFVERALRVVDRVLARRIEHEEADEAIGIVRDGQRDRVGIAGQARDQRRPLHAVLVELGDPARAERVAGLGKLPAEPGDACRDRRPGRRRSSARRNERARR